MFDLLKIFFIKKAIANGGNLPTPAGEGSLPSSVGGGSLSSGESAGGGNLFDPGKFLPGGLPTDLGALIETIFRWVLWAATLVFLYQAFRAAWDLITKKEAETALRDAKKRLWNALIGFMILLFAQSIPGIIRDILTG